MSPLASTLIVVTQLLSAPPAVAAEDKAVAAAPRGSVTLTQDQAVAKAVARHPIIRAARHAVSGAKATVSMSKSAWIPRIQIEAGYVFMGPQMELSIDTSAFMPPGIPATPITLESGSLHNATFGLSVFWRAYDFGARDVRTQAAKALVVAAKAEGKERAATIAYAVRASYLAARFFDEMDGVIGRSLRTAQAERREEKVRKQAGVGNDLNLARADIRVAQLDAQLKRTRQEHERALATLRLLLGLPKGTTLRLADGLKTLGSRPVKGRVNTKSHPTRLRLSALEKATKLEVKRLWRSYWPTLDIVGSVKAQYPKNFFENDVWGPSYLLGVRLTWNVFDGDLLRRQRRQARAKVRQVRSLGRAADEDIQRKLVDARARIRIAASAAISAQRTLKAAAVYQRAARASRKAGSGTALEVRKAEEAVDQAHLGELKAYFDGALARAAYLMAQGTGATK